MTDRSPRRRGGVGTKLFFEPAMQASSNRMLSRKNNMEVRNCCERILSRIFHVTLTTGIVLILVLKNTGSVNFFFFVKTAWYLVHHGRSRVNFL